MSVVKVEMNAENDVDGQQESQGGHNHSMGGRGGGRGGGRQRFGGPGGRQRDDMRGGMRQDVSKVTLLLVFCIKVWNVLKLYFAAFPPFSKTSIVCGVQYGCYV
jgi:hypothetical protein